MNQKTQPDAARTVITAVALYLPQFHPIPENDEWWGKGFTEWTNVTKAKPLFRGHHQPDLPADLGFYDLRVPEVREEQAELARRYGIGAFCYYHYWFGEGRRLLNRPFDEVLATGKPDFPFMLCWANETWSGVWHGVPDKTLIEQRYLGRSDEIEHFKLLLGSFHDPRYLRVFGKPVFMIYRPANIPTLRETLAHFRQLATDAGLPGLYLIAQHPDPYWDCEAFGFDAYVNASGFFLRRSKWVPWSRPGTKIKNWVLEKLGRPTVIPYEKHAERIVPSAASPLAIPCVVPGWDNTPRSGSLGLVFQGATPSRFEVQVRRAVERINSTGAKNGFLFIKSWNEWAEGNHLEPCQRFGHGYLQALKRALDQGSILP
jgi:hypothetical protein